MNDSQVILIQCEVVVCGEVAVDNYTFKAGEVEQSSNDPFISFVQFLHELIQFILPHGGHTAISDSDSDSEFIYSATYHTIAVFKLH